MTLVEPHPIKPRRVRFDYADTPMHWIPGDPHTTHVINVLHLLLPAGEKWFCDLYRQAPPLATDDQLREDVKGFIGQEAVHSRAHAAVLDHFAAQGLDTSWYTRWVDVLFGRVLSDNFLGLGRAPGWLKRKWFHARLAIVAAIEHFTCVLGVWIIEDSHALDDAGADPTMLDLLRWHGAEEVEHRSVAFDLFQHVSGSYALRVLAMIGVLPAMLLAWFIGTGFLIHQDATAPPRTRVSITRFVRAGRKGRLPSVTYLRRSVPRYLARDYHPSVEGSTALALACLAKSPAALAAGY